VTVGFYSTPQDRALLVWNAGRPMAIPPGRSICEGYRSKARMITTEKDRDEALTRQRQHQVELSELPK
jgi:hypothetical protein